MKKSLLLIALFFSLIINAQEDKSVILTVTGTGKTIEEAKQSALRSAIEQAFGAFISTRTEILNDAIISDQITSVANGNIQSFEILNESQLPDGTWGTTLKANVSVGKLTSFVQAKGVVVEIKGGLFAMNIKQQILNEQGEFYSIYNLIGLLHEQFQTAFDYIIESGNPKSTDSESKNWEIPIVVKANANKNMDFCADYFIKTIANFSLSSEEKESYINLNKEVYSIKINYKGGTTNLYLRNKKSVRLLNSFLYNFYGFTHLFSIKNGVDEVNITSRGNFFNFFNSNFKEDEKGITIEINFPTNGDLAASYKWNDKRTIAEIEKMDSYKITPKGIISHFNHGGIIINEENGHGLVISLCDVYLDEITYKSAENQCDELVIGSYNDWKIPSKEELVAISTISHKNEIFGLYIYNYWSRTYGEYKNQGRNEQRLWVQRLVKKYEENGKLRGRVDEHYNSYGSNFDDYEGYVRCRPVRSF